MPPYAPGKYRTYVKDKSFKKRTYTFKKRSPMANRNALTRYSSSRPELKSLDTTSTVSLFGGTAGAAQMTLLNGCQQGTALWSRNGNKIALKSLYLTAMIQQTGNAQTTNIYGRIMIVYDRQANQLAPGGVTGGDITSLLQDTNAGGTNDNSAFAKINLGNRSRYKILMDEHILLPSCTTGGTMLGWDPTADDYKIKKYLKLPSLDTEFASGKNNGDITDITVGSLYLITYSDELAANVGWHLNFSNRLRFNDL